MPDPLTFGLKRHENILSSLARYVSGHTEYVNDFSEGSITRSILEAIAQELYRQNVSYAQGITSAIKSAVKNAFNFPLRNSTKAYGEFVISREMLPAPATATLIFPSVPEQTFTGSIAGAVFTGTTSGSTLTVPTNGMIQGNITVGMVLSANGLPENTYISAFAPGTTGGVGTYTLSTSPSPALGSTTFTGYGLAFTASGTSISLQEGMGLKGSGVLNGTYIASLNSDGQSGYVGPGAMVVGTLSGNVLTVTSVLTGKLAVGHKLLGFGSLGAGTITNFLSGTGGTGTYYLDIAGTISPSRTFVSNGQNISGTTSSNLTAFGSLFRISNFSSITTATTPSVGIGAIVNYSVNNYGSIQNVIVNTPSSGYKQGDVLQINAPLSSSISDYAICAVTSINGTGGITGISLLYSGSGYPTSATSSSTTVATGVLSGLYYYSIVPIIGNNTHGFIEKKSSSISSIQISSAQNIQLTWTAIPNANGYRIYRSTDARMLNAKYTTVTGGSTSVFIDSALSAYTSNPWPGMVMSYGISSANAPGGGTRSESSAKVVTGIPTGSTAQLTWSAVNSIDAASTPVGFNIYSSSFDATAIAPSNLNASISTQTNASSPLSANALVGAVTFSGNTMKIHSDNAVTLNKFAIGHVLSGSSKLISGTTIVKQTLVTTQGKSGEYLVSQTYSSTGGSGATVSYTVSDGKIVSITDFANGGSGYAVGDHIAVTGAGDKNAVIQINSVSSGAATITTAPTIVYAGTNYNAGSSIATTANAAANVSGSLTYYYGVSTITSTAQSAISNIVSISVTSTYPSVYLSWDAVTGAVGYRIYRDTSPDFVSPSFYDTLSNFFYDTGALITQSKAQIPSSFILSQTTTPSVLSYKDSGSFRAYRSWPYTGSAFSIQGPIVIPSGTQVSIPSTYLTYSLISSATISPSSQTVTTIIRSDTYGLAGNASANTITEFLSSIYGVSGGYNPRDITNGYDIETDDEWKMRFSKYLQSLSRGTESSIAAGVLGSTVVDNNGFVIDEVTKSLVTSPSTLNLYVYIHNGKTEGVSSDLIAQTQKIINGYVMPDGTKVPGYKAAGIPATVFSATVQPQNIIISVTPRSGFPIDVIRYNLLNVINQYFSELDISDGLYIPSIATVAPSSGALNDGITYKYKLIAVDSQGNKSASSTEASTTIGSTVPNNVISWTVSSGGPSIASYDLLRWDGTQWGLVANIPVSTASVSYTDVSPIVYPYTEITYPYKYLNKSDLLQELLQTPGILTLSITIPNSSGVDQNYVIPISGRVLVPGTISVN